MDAESTELTVKALECEPVKNLLSPVTKELGNFAGDLANLVRFYTTSNLEKVFKKWAHQRHGNEPLTVEQVGKVIPLLQAASLQADDELQERWAALLESTVSAETGMLPSFGQTLSQLTADEARYLSALYSYAKTLAGGDGQYLGEVGGLIDVYGKVMKSAENIPTGRLIIQDLQRLGLLIRLDESNESVARVAPSDDLFAREMMRAIEASGVEFRSVFSISEYGACFIQAVTPRRG